jgi:hypothetical protein
MSWSSWQVDISIAPSGTELLPPPAAHCPVVVMLSSPFRYQLKSTDWTPDANTVQFKVLPMSPKVGIRAGVPKDTSAWQPAMAPMLDIGLVIVMADAFNVG